MAARYTSFAKEPRAGPPFPDYLTFRMPDMLIAMDSLQHDIADLRIRVEKLERLLEQLYGAETISQHSNEFAPAWETEARELILSGREIDAITLVRRQTNGSLAEAKMRVESLKSKL